VFVLVLSVDYLSHLWFVLALDRNDRSAWDNALNTTQTTSLDHAVMAIHARHMCSPSEGPVAATTIDMDTFGCDYADLSVVWMMCLDNHDTLYPCVCCMTCNLLMSNGEFVGSIWLRPAARNTITATVTHDVYTFNCESEHTRTPWLAGWRYIR